MKGVGDLLLVVVVVGATWTRTPVGGLFDRLVHAVRGGDDLPALTSYFTTAAPPITAEIVAHALDLAAPAGGPFPEPWRTAAVSVLGADGLSGLDARYAGDPEAALELASVGEDLRTRAIERARSAGAEHPDRYAEHRAYLPSEAAREGDRVVSGTLALASVLTLEWPVRVPHRITSPFGWRIHPITHDRRKHDGVDLGVPIGTQVYAAQAGKVIAVGTNEKGGNWIIMDHGNGVRTSYCHLSEWQVTKGQVVQRGEPIALSGNTGRSTGPHLHFNVKVSGTLVDPLLLRREPPPTRL